MGWTKISDQSYTEDKQDIAGFWQIHHLYTDRDEPFKECRYAYHQSESDGDSCSGIVQHPDEAGGDSAASLTEFCCDGISEDVKGKSFG